MPLSNESEYTKDYRTVLQTERTDICLLDLLQSTSSGALPDPFVQRRDTRNSVGRVHWDLWELGLRGSRQRRSRVDGIQRARDLAGERVAVGNRNGGFGRSAGSALAFD